MNELASEIADLFCYRLQMNGTMRRWIRHWPGVTIGAALLALLMIGCGRATLPAPALTATLTPEPIAPTRTPLPVIGSPGTAATPAPASATIPPDATPPPKDTATPAATLSPRQIAALDRIGVAGALPDVEPGRALGLRFGHFTFWRTWPHVPEAPGVTIWQTVRLGQIGEWGEWPAVGDLIEETIQLHPGAFWMVGNEPDVPWQDNATAEEYAEAYHDIYAFIKERDPSARVGAGGIALPTPLRLAWLDSVLQRYHQRYGEPMPVDLWAIHLFVLREEAGSWGIGIPPGMTETAGQLHEIEDHGDIELMKAYVNAFRSWMAANDYADKPLAVTEFGILLPEDYGFPPEFVQNYMTEAYEYFRTASGDDGLAVDGDRLVQYAFWYSLYDEGDYKTGDLLNRGSGALTPLGQAFIHYVDGLIDAP